MKEKNKPLHLEFGFSTDKKINRNILKLASSIDSIGLDEQEVINSLNSLGNSSLAEKIHNFHDIKDIFIGCKNLIKKTKVKRLHLHGKNYFLTLTRDTEIPLKEISKAMSFASIVAEAYAIKNIKEKEDIKHGFKSQVSKDGLKNIQKLSRFLDVSSQDLMSGVTIDKNNFIVSEPIRMSKKVRDVVGLGDIISSIIFAYETGVLINNKSKL